jgi:hypothetical protein
MSDDLVGLIQSIDWSNVPQPLWRLIETTCRGLGKAGMTFFLGARGRGEAKKIDAIATAIRKHSSGPLSLTYKDETLTIQTLDSHQQVNIPAATFEQRTEERVRFQNQQEQLRIDNTIEHAAEDLRSETQVPEEKPSDDFVARFFDYAKTISTEHMQQLWGRILSGEIKRPGTYSLRTLDLVRNISQQEAEMFEQVTQYAFCAGTDALVPVDIAKYSGGKLVYRHLLTLAEIGLLHSSDSSLNPFKNNVTNFLCAFSNDVAVSIVRDPKVHFRVEPPLSVRIFTNPARQLAQLIPWENPTGYVDTFCEEVKKLGWIPTIGTYTNPNAPEFHENPRASD